MTCRLSNERGFTLFEVMVTLLLSSIVFVAAMQVYTAIAGLSYDHHLRIETNVQAQAIMQTIGNEVRILGNGVPFDQPHFQIGETTLSDPGVTEPIIVGSSTSNSISFRMNETGEVALLTASFNPASSLTISLTDTAGLQENDPVYLSNSVVSGAEGLYGVIASVDSAGKTVTLNANPVFSPDAIFPMGSTLEEVPIVTYSSNNDGTITRDSGYGAVLLGSNASLEFEYLAPDGTALALPLTQQTVIDSLRAIRITVTLTHESLMKSGENYTATVSQVFGLRNLTYLY